MYPGYAHTEWRRASHSSTGIASTSTTSSNTPPGTPTTSGNARRPPPKLEAFWPPAIENVILKPSGPGDGRPGAAPKAIRPLGVHGH
eukprot:428428-Rhodomonas_salina.2